VSCSTATPLESALRCTCAWPAPRASVSRRGAGLAILPQAGRGVGAASDGLVLCAVCDEAPPRREVGALAGPRGIASCVACVSIYLRLFLSYVRV
jgi:hypothetical protein